jgi:hypothetical protein
VRLDELITAAAGLGTYVWRLDYSQTDSKWHCVLEDSQSDPLALYEGDGAEAVDAVASALTGAGISIAD